MTLKVAGANYIKSAPAYIEDPPSSMADFFDYIRRRNLIRIMRLEVFLMIFLVPLCLAENPSSAQRSPRTPQGHIEYNDPDGHKVSWKLYAPYTQWKSHLDNPQSREGTEQAETIPQPKLAKPQEPTPVEKQQQPQIEQQVEYKPYSMVPTHIKQLIFKMYEPQGPYVDPTVYIYHTPQTHSEDQTRSAQPEQKADRRQEAVSQETENYQEPGQQKISYKQATEQEATYQQERTAASHHQQQSVQPEASRYQQGNEHLVSGYEEPLLEQKVQFAYGKYPVKEGHVEYKNQNSESKPAQYGFVPQRAATQPQLAENNMPSLLQQLLNLQAQTPYYVIANRITYKPKKMFIPKPISQDDKGAYTYPSKVYYLRDDDVDQEDKSVKHVKEDKRR